MHRFIHYENIKHFKELLERTADEAERDRILKLLTEEEAKTPDDQPEKKSENIVAGRVMKRDLTPCTVGIAIVATVGAMYVIFSTTGLSPF